VLTGVMELMAREKLETFIKNHGGACPGSVSGKTTHLVHGVKLEDGREVTQGSKYRAAKAKGTPILSETEFE
jgi:replication factor C subunit 1